ncbi:D-2-hydroxyacid dehydrogenase [Nocardia jiangsuensis]|uniref:D-2-hydroxyacid dehydrogenase n=1 Tax=Nocardia jiangsuensis TaxID=1691563 RepID=A0ABV8DQQ0_9NOCA
MRSYGVNVDKAPVITILHGGRPPEPGALARVAERAELRWTDAAGLPAALPGTDVLFVLDFGTDALPAAWPRENPPRWVHMGSTGVDAAMFPALISSDVVVTNTRGVFDAAIAEYVLGQIIGFAKDFGGALLRQHRREWEHRETERVAGASVLIVGTGGIGRAIARLLRAVGMRVSAIGRRERTGDPDFGTVGTDLRAELPHADYVVAVAPLTERTRHLFDAAAFAAMKPHARFVNVGRGELVVTGALVDALRTGAIAGAALDVVDPEPLPAEHPLWTLPGVRITPHNSGDWVGWSGAILSAFADNFDNWVAGRPLRNVVDKQLGYVPG